MPTKEQVLSSLAASSDYGAAGRACGIPAGQAYLIATGLPADGSGGVPPDELDLPGVLAGSTQHLVYSSAWVENPTSKAETHAWVKERAAIDLPMQRAARQRQADPGEVKDPLEQDPPDTDITTVLTRDHDQVVALMKQLKAIPGVTAGGSPSDLARRKSIADLVAVALDRHEAAEQEGFWPAVRRLCPDLAALADAAVAQEQAGKDLLRQLGRAKPSDERFDRLVTELDTAARKHVALEDRVLLTLAARIPDDVRHQIGLDVANARRKTPKSAGTSGTKIAEKRTEETR